MKQILICLILLTAQRGISQISTSSKESQSPQSNETVISTPKPVNRLHAFSKYISDNIRVPENEDFPGGKIIVSFFVEVDGTVGDIKILKDIGYGTAQEITRILKKSPKWKPAEKDGVPVRTQFTLPVSISRN